jgi:hypothetical protein
MEKYLTRFQSKIDFSGDCWLWTAGLSKKGYGQFYYDGKMWATHRLAYFLANGELPPAPLIIRHKCRSKNCVNPDHLEPGTIDDNNQDKKRDGTQNTGENHGSSKLTWEQVAQIRIRPESGRQLAKEYEVSHTVIQKVRRCETWK